MLRVPPRADIAPPNRPRSHPNTPNKCPLWRRRAEIRRAALSSGVNAPTAQDGALSPGSKRARSHSEMNRRPTQLKELRDQIFMRRSKHWPSAVAAARRPVLCPPRNTPGGAMSTPPTCSTRVSPPRRPVDSRRRRRGVLRPFRRPRRTEGCRAESGLHRRPPRCRWTRLGSRPVCALARRSTSAHAAKRVALYRPLRR